MTQTTIKEKIQEIARINEAEYGHVHIDFIRDFARLICEEMTKENLDIGWLNLKQAKVGKEFEKGYINRIEETKQKAQEILKALE